MNLLHLDSSILGPLSASRQLSASAVAALTAQAPAAKVVYRDLAASPIPHLSGAQVAAWRNTSSITEQPNASAETDDVALGSEVLEEFLAADTVVIGVAFYNFTIASNLKAWVDRIAVAGKTFRYTEDGPEGLCGDKRVILMIARGGIYSQGAPSAAMEHAETYLRGVFAFMGITSPDVIVAEGLAISPEQREASLAAAETQIAKLV
ncbi:FMN-dependent NADH-azoreductase [Sphingomonas bisphenolicum]